RRIDFLGALTAAGATVCLLLGLTWGGQMYPWDSVQVIATLSAAVVLFIAFFFVERFATEPILPLDLFRNQVFAAGSALALMVGMTLFAVVIYLPLFIQAVLKQTATSSGAVITPMTLAMGAGAVVIGFVIARIGRYQFIAIIGALVMTGGIYLFSQMNTSTTLFEVTRNMIIVGVGMGLLQPVMTLAVQNAIPRTRLGVGTGAVTYLRSMGSTLGVAIIGAVVNNTVTMELAKRLPAGASLLPKAAVSPAAIQQVLVDPGAQQVLIAQASKGALQQTVGPAVQQAIAQASAAHRIPPTGPAHDQAIAAITQQVTQAVTAQVTQQMTNLFNQIFEASRMALAIGIGDAFKVGLIMCGVIIIITLFLKDVPLAKRAPERAAAGTPGEGGSPEADEAPAPQLIEM
ncbi:MAG: MFS transporter, partial [Ktedonobacterales bacterium]